MAAMNMESVTQAEFSRFKSEAKTVLQFAKWLGVFMATLGAAIIFQIISVSYSAGKLETQVAAQSKEMERLSTLIEKQSTAIEKLAHELLDVKLELAKLSARQKP